MEVSRGHTNLLEQLEEVSNIVRRLQRIVQATTDAGTLDLLDVTALQSVLRKLQELARTLESKLAPVKGWRKVKKALNWPFQMPDIMIVLRRIERYKFDLSLLLQNYQMYVFRQRIQLASNWTAVHMCSCQRLTCC